MHCTRRDCSDRNQLVTDHGTAPDTGLPLCFNCGDYLSARALPLRHTLAGGAPGSGEPWEGSWGRVGDEWGLRVYMPDNDHREDDPEEGHEIRVTTRKGRVSVMKLGPLLASTRSTRTFAAPPRD
jgi:hypothetical protein